MSIERPKRRHANNLMVADSVCKKGGVKIGRPVEDMGGSHLAKDGNKQTIGSFDRPISCRMVGSGEGRVGPKQVGELSDNLQSEIEPIVQEQDTRAAVARENVAQEERCHVLADALEDKAASNRLVK